MRKNVLLAIYLALAIFLSVLETLVLPTTIIPGSKIGLANLVSLVVIYLYGVKEAVIIAFLRVISVSLIVGTLFSPTFIISLTGLVVSLCMLVIAFKSNLFGCVGVSVFSSVGHIIGQGIAVILLTELTSISLILPLLIYIAILSGVVNGIISNKIIKKMEEYNEI